MEEYILNYYKKWINEQKGSIAQQLSRLTKTANFLLISLFATLAVLIIIFALAAFKVIAEPWIFVPVLLEIIISIASYVYTSKHDIEHSEDELDKYKEHCRKLSIELKTKHITSRVFIQEIIDRYRNLISESNRTIERNQDNTIKAMQILIIPLSLEVLKEIINRQSDLLEVIEAWFTSLMAIATLCLLVAWSVYMCISLTIKKRQNDYKQMARDLQGIIDLDKFDPTDEKTETVAKAAIHK